MRFQDAIKFSLEWVLPQKATRSLENTTDALFDAVLADSAPAALRPIDPMAPLRVLIEDMDRARYGGLSFGPETIDRMTVALHRALTAMPMAAEALQMHLLAESILRTAGNGERDPGRLAAIALADLGPITTDA